MAAACLCGLLKEATNENSPLVFEPRTRKYRLRVAKDTIVNDAKCLMCGGQDNVARPLCMCNCDSVEAWAARGDLPVYRDTGNGMYMFGRRDVPDQKQIHYAIWYCPVCGGRMKDGHPPRNDEV